MTNKPVHRDITQDQHCADFDRFDICTAWYLLAHDYGLYKTVTRLQRYYGASPLLSHERIKNIDEFENVRAIYDNIAAWFDDDLSRCDYYTY